jgi:protein SCO1/2
MSDIKRALADMAPEDADRVRVSFATVDPDRDDGARMTEYLAKFVDDGQVLRTDDPAALKSAAASFGVSYQVTTNEDGEVEVGHTGDVFAVNSEGTVVMQWPFGTDPESLASDLTSLLDAEAEQTLEGSA